MPAEGVPWLPRSEMLTFEEIERIATVMVERFGIASIRLTGGEPTLRANVEVLIAKLATLGVELSITTNGTMLTQQADKLRRAGLHRVNVSLDSLRPDRFAQLTRRDDLDRVLAGIDAAVAAGFDPVKLNVVAMRGVNGDEVVDFARFGRERGVVVRFIEFMPLDAEERWSPESVLSQAEILERIAEVFPVEPVQRGHEPAERFRYVDGGGEVGVIPSVTRPFCEACDRVRLTSEGALRNCLFAVKEVDLREILRGGGTDDDLAEAIAGEVRRKWAGHAIGQSTFVRPRKSMSQIGG
jgi:cyclic pyranopterin phosphate synthase